MTWHPVEDGKKIHFRRFDPASAGRPAVQAMADACRRPMAPEETDYNSREKVQEAGEEYFAQASIYITCVDMWIEDAWRRYQEMFAREVGTYRLQRQDVLDELRRFTGTTR